MSFSKYLLHTLPDSYVAVDLETTGLDSNKDVIIEMAAVKVENGNITARFESLVNPGREVSAYITKLTEITNDMLTKAPTLDQVLPDFLSLIQSDVMLGHNFSFDLRFLRSAAASLGLPFEKCQYVDTLSIARRVFPEWKHNTLPDLVKNLHVEGAGAHRAMPDALSTKGCYDALRKAAAERGMTEKDLSTVLSESNLTVQPNAYRPIEGIEGKTFVFTGDMARMTHKEAEQKVLNAGGYYNDKNVTNATNYLVMSNEGYSKVQKGEESRKYKTAMEKKLKGMDIEVISEDVFLEMLEPEA